MSSLFFMIVLTTLIFIIFPTAFRLVFMNILGFSKAHIKIKHPMKYMGLWLELSDPIWGFQVITIYVPEIRIKLDAKNLKICVVIDKPRIMLTRNKSQLLPIRIVDGVESNNLLYNLVTILKNIKPPKQRQKENRNNETKNRGYQNRIVLALKAAVQFIFLIAIQFIEIKILNGESAIVSSMPKGSFKFDIINDIRSSIILLECFAQYLLYIDDLTIGAYVHSDREVNVSAFCENLKLYTAQHMENNLIMGQKLMVKIRIPLSFSIQESLKRVGVYISIPFLTANSTPVDFQNLSNILNQFLFSPELFYGRQFNTKETNTQKSEEEQVDKKIVLIIDEATMKMTELCEQDYDTPEALKYLSNISQVLLRFKKIKLNEEGFKVQSVSLGLKKYNEQDQQYALQKNKKNQNKELLKIDNLLITKQGRITNISHDDVRLSCQREELALLGKLFTLINSRVIKDQYEEKLYAPFIEIAKNFSQEKVGLAETIQLITAHKNQLVHKQESIQEFNAQGPKKESQIIYSPRQIELFLDISELVHKITLSSSQYRQSRTGDGQIIHELTFKRILLEHKEIKEFSIDDFRLQYRQASSSNELDLQIKEAKMIQNFQTLKDYLIGFTMFKMLLQFSTDQEEENNAKKVNKAGKKHIVFGKIVLNYATQLLSLTKLSILKETGVDGKLSSLYFSLQKGNISVENLTEGHKKLKYPLQNSHKVLFIESITLKQFLAASSEPGSSPKQKYMIHFKRPVFLLPQIDITERVMNYVKTFNKLQPSIEAFIQNTTDEKIKAKRRKYKIFMIDTNIFVMKITDLLIGIKDTVLDSFMLNRMRFEREYLSRKPKYNESETVNYLKQTAKTYNLFQIKVECISIDVKPLVTAGSNEKSVKDWALKVKEKYTKVDREYNETPRLIRANNLNLIVELTKLETKIRDYPFNIANISKIKGNLQYLKTKNIYEETQHYLVVQMAVDEIQVEIGLNLLSGLSEIYKKLQKYDRAIDQYKNTDEFLYSLRTKSNLQLSKFKPYWHIMHKSMDWFVSIEKQSQIKARLLTGLTPYSQESVDLHLGKISFKSNPIKTQFSIQSLELYGNKLKIFEVGRQTISVQSIYNQPDLNLNIRLDIESEKNINNSHLKDNRVRISEQIIKQLWKIKQLRTDWLLIYGLVDTYSKQQQNVLKRQDQSNYVDLIRIAANMKLKNKDRLLTIFSVLKEVKISFSVDKFCLQLADQDNEVDLIVSNFSITLVAEARAQKWKMRHFLLQLQNIIGRLKMYRKKQLTLYASNHQFLTLFNQLKESQIHKRKQQKQLFREIFLVCRGLKLRLNQYGKVNEEILYILKKLEINTLKIQLTKELKKMIDALLLSIFESNKEKMTTVKTSNYFRKSALQKMREMVVLVIRANRKRKKVCNRLKVYVIIRSIEVGFKTAKRLLLLTNGKPTTLGMNTTFHSKDLYRIDPKISVNWLFSDVQIWMSMDPNHLWVFGRGYSPNNTLQAERIVKSAQINLLLDKYQNQNLPEAYEKIVATFNIQRFTNLNLQFRSGQIQLTHQNIEVLKQIGEILISLVDSKEQKKKQWKAEKDKYSEMITHGRQLIQNKLIWKYTDVSKGPAPHLQSKVHISLDEIKIILVSTRNQKTDQKQQRNSKQRKQNASKKRYPFLNLVSSNIEAQIQVYNDSNMSKQFKINNLGIINCIEPSDSNFRTLFEMNHAENLAVRLRFQECLLPATDPRIGWTFYKSVYIHFNPVKIKFTEELYTQIYHFFFGIKPDDQEKEEELSNILPDYYVSIIIDELKVQAWYRTPSLLKRLQGVNVGLQKFQLKEVFLHKKGVFDLWVSFLLKQLASQFFNVIGQKLFG